MEQHIVSIRLFSKTGGKNMSANSQPLIATIYNPHNQSKEALIAGFIARKQKFERIFRDIRDSTMTKPEQHYLIQGIRGMGKTTLLLRIAYEIENTPELRQRLIPIVFNEEEYGIGSLADVWERTAQYLGEADIAFADLYDNVTKLYGQDDYEQRAFQAIIDALQKQNKKLLLLIDNIGDVLKKLDTQEEKRLREILLTTSELRLIGATSVAIEQVHDYTKPFYEFFKMIHLEGLAKQEAIELFLKLGETYHTEAVQQLIERQPGRIEAIRRLTGGVIRTMVLLFEILVENGSGSVFRDLNILLDRVTPLYKHRLDDLPAQQQKIVAALAQAWDAASAKELAQVVRLESKVVSAQLKQLIDNNVVEKVETKTKNHLYRLDERFFNIWYLMRFGRKTDQRVLWLIRFFETMFAGDEEWMQERIDGHLKAMEVGTLDPEAALYLTTAFSTIIKDEEIEDKLKKTTRIYLITKGYNSLAANITYSKQEQVTEIIHSGKYAEAIKFLSSFNNKNEAILLDLSACYLMNDETLLAEENLIKSFTDKKEYLINDINDHQSVSLAAVIGLVNGVKIDIEINGEVKKNLFSTDKSRIAAEIAIQYFTNKLANRKNISFSIVEKFIQKAVNTVKDIRAFFVYDIINLWNDYYLTSYTLNKYIDGILSHLNNKNSIFNDPLNRLTKEFLELLLAKKQYHTAYNYFQQEEWQLKDRFKPLYYATLHFLKDEYPTDYLRMGSELKETVDDVLSEVAQMAIDYA
ncbi:ATP-binding protein [Spirosoma sp. BT702]|uniref:ATP-binding protein n=1 Tax=Spirosoma profusum TaxID=2771354 RepID=A0A926XTR3_9BACT|nr:ATP-binding protein [Spirosoma profusum]MBD2699415.1 ATP-binding protein [Spirosoma profusum]